MLLLPVGSLSLWRSKSNQVVSKKFTHMRGRDLFCNYNIHLLLLAHHLLKCCEAHQSLMPCWPVQAHISSGSTSTACCLPGLMRRAASWMARLCRRWSTLCRRRPWVNTGSGCRCCGVSGEVCHLVKVLSGSAESTAEHHDG